MKRFAVVILNWNGAPDTVDCVRSIQRSDPGAVSIIVDNGSTDGSVEYIRSALAEECSVLVGSTEEISRDAAAIVTADVVLVRGVENLGFAAGCNLGLRLAAAAGFEFTVFLNNDTEVDALALSRIVERLAASREYFAVLPRLMVWNTDRIWNCGGVISRLGYRRYYHSDSVASAAKLPAEIECSFFTGCCFAVRTSEFAARNGFTERFFFGEEDIELGFWMKDSGRRALCLTDAVVHHKVGASISRAAGHTQASKVFVHYLNRFIHMRLRLGSVLWGVWVAAYLPYVALLLVRGGIVKLAEFPIFVGELIRRARSGDRVTRAEFQAILRERPW